MRFYLLQKHSRPALWPIHLPTIAIQWIPEFFPLGEGWGVKMARVKNEWSCITTPPVCLKGVDRDTFTFVGSMEVKLHTFSVLKSTQR
jgi:hypothetical protein